MRWPSDRLTFLRWLMLGLLLALAAGPTAAQPVLTVTGRIASGAPASFDVAQLEALGRTRLETSTKWSEPAVYDGILIATLLDALGASGTELVAVALNDYKVTIPIDDLRRNEAIIAYARDGAAMPVRSRGPFWLLYPFDQKPALKTDVYYARCVWQLKALEVR